MSDTILSEIHCLASKYHENLNIRLNKVQKWLVEQFTHDIKFAYKTINKWIDQVLLEINIIDLLDLVVRRKRVTIHS